jgi:hypothetical protein
VVVLVINHADHDGYADLVDGYLLPVLQDTAEADVFGAYGAIAYVLVAVGRGGEIDLVERDVFPDGDRASIEALLVERLR